VLALEVGGAGGHRLLARVQAHDRQTRDALPATGFADDSERPALLDREADPVDCLDDAVVRAEVRPQLGHLEQRHYCSRIRGSMKAYRMSTIRLITMMHIVANTTIPSVVGRSNASRLLSSVRPSPGSPYTVSVKTAPPSAMLMSIPSIVTT